MLPPLRSPASATRRRHYAWARALIAALGVCLLAGFTAWGAMALLFDGPGPGWLRGGLVAGFVLLVGLAVIALPRPAGQIAGAALCGVVLLWWLQIPASNDRDWAPEYARLASVARDGDRITVRNIRNFTYRTEADVTPAYDDATYDLATLDTMDLVTSYWAGDEITHVFVSFGFRDGRHLAISIETRREKGESYSTLAGFFRHYELIYVVADERDLIGLRTDTRSERVYLYQLRLPPKMVRRLFVSYLDRVAALEHRPEFYNTLTNNCTTGILGRAQVVSPTLAYNWRILASGHAAEYAYHLGRLDNRQPFPELRQARRIQRPTGATVGPGFSTEIRESLG